MQTWVILLVSLSLSCAFLMQLSYYLHQEIKWVCFESKSIEHKRRHWFPFSLISVIRRCNTSESSCDHKRPALRSLLWFSNYVDTIGDSEPIYTSVKIFFFLNASQLFIYVTNLLKGLIHALFPCWNTSIKRMLMLLFSLQLFKPGAKLWLKGSEN